jgi:hypothetical protein
MDDLGLLYKVSVRLNCETLEVFQIVIAREKRKKDNCVDALLEWRTEAQLVEAFNRNYINCAYVPQFVIDHCRSMLSRQIEPARTSVRRIYGGNSGSLRTPRHLSLAVREKHSPEQFSVRFPESVFIGATTTG